MTYSFPQLITLYKEIKARFYLKFPLASEEAPQGAYGEANGDFREFYLNLLRSTK